ncbi:hypothetical protein NH673_06500 [Pseudomonas putida]|uniref:antitoxin Xre-like helix-turn-helix domain-containing protein n=1 Tax=Pseudomonas putida TaxID=303 RepID=UPI0006B4A722|nr:antitoxin Xre-like helix-turn-helix domain-containing protein [Pseudomonas putida]USX37990.1 hypothetical protein NH673_06500 [Pseudomonas putida]
MAEIGKLTELQCAVGLRAAIRIIDGWQATQSQARKILRISASTYQRARREGGFAPRLDRDQQQRLGLVLGIHSALRKVFDNPENVRGFPRFQNENLFFEGRSPLEVISQGDMISLYETFRRIEQLQLGT